MKVYHSLEHYDRGDKTVATIGTFDGVHIGHQTILKRLKTRAAAIGGETVLISFHPHPRLVLFPENNPLRLLHALEEKIAYLEKLGLDKLLLIPFTKDFSRTPSKAFIEDILVKTIGIHTIIIGYDHHFGKNRTGGIEELRELSHKFRYEVEEIPAQAIDDANVSSTKIRKALLEGDIHTANKYLGYAYPITGKVIHGEKQGRKLGYPTANIQPLNVRKLIPADGIYFVRVSLPSTIQQAQNGILAHPPQKHQVHLAPPTHYGLMNIGKKPTMGEFERTHEVFILDFQGDLYDKVIRVELLDYMRGEKKFDSLEALIQAMDKDKARALELIKRYGPLLDQ